VCDGILEQSWDSWLQVLLNQIYYCVVEAFPLDFDGDVRGVDKDFLYLNIETDRFRTLRIFQRYTDVSL
jgi:hypothetical protein